MGIRKFRKWSYRENKMNILKGKHMFENFEGNDLLMQSTGRKDINRKEIFEGDIIKGIIIYDGTEQVGRVYYDIVSTKYAVDLPYSWESLDSLALSDFESCEIIGNIYDIPKELKQRSNRR